MTQFYDFHKTIFEKLNKIKEFKQEEDGKRQLNDFFTDQLADVSVLEDKIFTKFLNIAWENCMDTNKATEALSAYLKELEKEHMKAKVIENCILGYQLLTETARSIIFLNFSDKKKTKKTFFLTKDQFKNAESKILYLKAFQKIAYKRTKVFINSTGKDAVFEVVKVNKRFDQFGM